MARKAETKKSESTSANIGFEAQMWQASDALRGSMDPGEYKHVTLGLIFLKYISDAFEGKHAALLAEKAQGAAPEDPDEYRAQGDTFHNDRHPNLKTDFILANPPFNISDWGGERLREDKRWQYGAPPAGNTNFAWVQHIVHHLAPAGVAGFVLANGSMSSNQSGEGEIRNQLIELMRGTNLLGSIFPLYVLQQHIQSADGYVDLNQ